jgi:hypothetical protein
MVFLRSEEHLDGWLDAHRWTQGESMTAPKLNELARRWWWTRLEPGWRRVRSTSRRRFSTT